MKKVLSILLILIMIFALTSCGNKYDGAYDYDSKYDADYEGTLSYKKTSDSLTSENELSKKNVKLVYKAVISAETNNFDKTRDNLKKLVNNYDGYFEKAAVDTSSYYQGYATISGEFIIRIPQEHYSEFIEKISGDANVVSINETVDNIGLEYYEVETHIESLKVEIARLQALMKDANSMTDIITIEKALTEAEYELSGYTTQKAKYDSLVDYATITLSLRQTSNYTPTNVSFWSELGSNLSQSFSNFVQWLKDFAFWIGYNLVTLIILAVLITLCVKFKWIKKIRAKFNKKKAVKNPPAEPQNYTYKSK